MDSTTTEKLVEDEVRAYLDRYAAENPEAFQRILDDESRRSAALALRPHTRYADIWVALDADGGTHHYMNYAPAWCQHGSAWLGVLVAGWIDDAPDDDAPYPVFKPFAGSGHTVRIIRLIPAED